MQLDARVEHGTLVDEDRGSLHTGELVADRGKRAVTGEAPEQDLHLSTDDFGGVERFHELMRHEHSENCLPTLHASATGAADGHFPGGTGIAREPGECVEIKPPHAELFDGLLRIEADRVNQL